MGEQRKVVPIRPQTLRPFNEGRFVGVRDLPPEQVIRNIDEWREAWPELAAKPDLKKHYDAIRASMVKKLEEQQGQQGPAPE